MKKTVLAMSVATLFSAGAMANNINVDVDNSVPHIPNNGIELPVDRPMPDNTPSRPEPVDPSFGVKPDSNVPDRDGPNYTPERPQPADPDFGVDVDSAPDRPQPADPDFGVDVDSTPDRPEPVDPSFGVSTPTTGDLVADLEKQMNHRFDEMSEHMDGIRAGLHAVTNARPFVTHGEFAVGAGIGFAGSKEALALGGAYGLTEKISLSGTFHYETSGKISGSEVAGGMGIQYKF
ncbi:YadA C-terminal domain-containing protein [Enterovibrio coralii]|uniref:Trimeric autotransporter adhesin YadA-like C-terminal membrane anchor domain-containing protein n=1 Tax=Enterovibrio coralii TaxID=294935 RepID=A0A135IB42_9GAMM|nr:YadA C-terminal domain-containing protein [Enterovibrio coralii]KXF82618.1 hypothetical protein ATN88_21385 [Enterovibrio coralii]